MIIPGWWRILPPTRHHDGQSTAQPMVAVRFHDGTMRILLLLMLSIASACTHSLPPAAPAPDPAAAVADFRTRLQAELKEGMAGGAEHALGICRDRAPRIAEESGTETMQVGRATLRPRNPANAPAAWLRPALDHYASHPEDRAPRTVALPDGGSGYIEPIHVQPLCLVCHGESIAPAVKQKLAELYPADLATGYREGDFRGVFWVTTRP